jgi:hypothetical protein
MKQNFRGRVRVVGVVPDVAVAASSMPVAASQNTHASDAYIWVSFVKVDGLKCDRSTDANEDFKRVRYFIVASILKLVVVT